MIEVYHSFSISSITKNGETESKALARCFQAISFPASCTSRPSISVGLEKFLLPLEGRREPAPQRRQALLAVQLVALAPLQAPQDAVDQVRLALARLQEAEAQVGSVALRPVVLELGAPIAVPLPMPSGPTPP